MNDPIEKLLNQPINIPFLWERKGLIDDFSNKSPNDKVFRENDIISLHMDIIRYEENLPLSLQFIKKKDGWHRLSDNVKVALNEKGLYSKLGTVIT